MGNTNDKCALCSEAGNGVSLISPGCCGQWYHQNCIMSILSSGQTTCTLCGQPFPQNILNLNAANATPLVIAQAVQPTNQYPPPFPPLYQQPQQHQHFISPTPLNQFRSPDGPILGNEVHVEEPVEAWIPPSTTSSTVESAQCNIIIEAMPELPQLSTDEKKSFYSVVSMSAITASLSSSASEDNAIKKSHVDLRPPMDIICVLDTSGSMSSDNKLVNLKHAVNFIREELGPNDRMSVITFETSAKEIHHLLRMTDSNKAKTQPAINALRPGGGTNILHGLEAAANMLQNRTTQNPISSVFLLTDGVDSANLRQKKTVAKRIKDMGASLFVFGFGNDHDSAHLKAIADGGEGLFTFIEQSDMVIDAFGGALGAEKSIFATNLCLTIRSANGVVISAANSGNYRKVLSPDGSSVSVYFNNLMKGEQRDMLLTLNIPTCEEATPQYILFTTDVEYSQLGAGGQVRHEGQPCEIGRVRSNDVDPNLERNIEVDVQVNRMLLAKATEESLARADNNDYQGARKALSDTFNIISNSRSALQKNEKVVAFAEELKVTLESVQDRDTYQNKGGRSMVSECNQTVSNQRCTYSKVRKTGTSSLYQSEESMLYQETAKVKKAAYMSK